ncbi:MAG: hypothetical protein ACOZAQ_10020 [Pseudomonadota bacterium]
MTRALLTLTFALLLTACSGKPGTGELQTLVSQELGASGQDAIYAVENFNKLNGYDKDGRYVAEVSYDLVFKKGLKDIAVEAEQSPGGPLDKLTKGMGLMSLGLLYGDFKAGDRLPRKQTLQLIKTEQGWRIDKE